MYLTFKINIYDYRLHVNIFDTDKKQFTIPESVISRPPAPSVTSYTQTSDLVFHYDSSPFAFWICRRSDPSSPPLFDTRIASLPQTPIPPSSDDKSTALDGFALVFEDQYLQVMLLLIRLIDPVLTLILDVANFGSSPWDKHIWSWRSFIQQRIQTWNW